jgi:hypothetical protein
MAEDYYGCLHRITTQVMRMMIARMDAAIVEHFTRESRHRIRQRAKRLAKAIMAARRSDGGS